MGMLLRGPGGRTFDTENFPLCQPSQDICGLEQVTSVAIGPTMPPGFADAEGISTSEGTTTVVCGMSDGFCLYGAMKGHDSLASASPGVSATHCLST